MSHDYDFSACSAEGKEYLLLQFYYNWIAYSVMPYCSYGIGTFQGPSCLKDCPTQEALVPVSVFEYEAYQAPKMRVERPNWDPELPLVHHDGTESPDNKHKVILDMEINGVKVYHEWNGARFVPARVNPVTGALEHFTHRFYLKFRLSEKELSWLKRELPFVAFISGCGGHDHPMANAARTYFQTWMYDQASIGERVLEIDSKIVAARKFNAKQEQLSQHWTKWGKLYAPKSVVSHFHEVTAKDSLRLEGVDPSEYIDTKLNDIPMDVTQEIRNVYSMHSLYYYTMEDICQFINERDVKLTAIVHRHDKPSGELFNGEIRYTMDVHGMVRQWNVKTSESYVHYTLEDWFLNSSFTMRHNGVKWSIGWTTKYIGAEHFMIIVKKTRIHNDGERIRFCDLYTEKLKTVQPGEMDGFGPFRLYKPLGDERPFLITRPSLYMDLKVFMLGRARNSETRAALFQYCRRLRDSTGLWSTNGKYLDLTDVEIFDHVCAAWVEDVDMEYRVLAGTLCSHHTAISKYNTMLKDDFVVDVSNVHESSQTLSRVMGASIKLAESVKQVRSVIK
jgi:hypothetical protein